MIPETSFTSEFFAYVRFLNRYFLSRLFYFYNNFEKLKDLIVAILVVKRGKYSQSFLNTSFFLLVSAALIGGPAIAESNPFIAEYFNQSDQSQAVLETDVYSLPIDTTVSQKPRDGVIEYEVKGGDTLVSIGKKFDVSAESIQWATNLQSATIKPGQKVKIPPVTGIVHKVNSGESIYSIAKRYTTDAQKIANWPFNDFADTDTFALTVGQTLYVPDGVPPQEKPRIIRGRAPTIAAGSPGSGSFIWPTSGSISQSPIWYHMAVDISNRSLPPVIAADTGTVTYAGCIKGGYGCHVRINHANGYETLYAHMSQLYVSQGQGISRGVAVGKLGSTGRSTGPHLHFEVRSGGKLLNPLGFLK